MKKLLIATVWFLLMVGCGLSTANKIQITEDSQFNYIMLGDYDLRIDKQFKFIGEIVKTVHGENIDDPKGTTFKTTRYLFVDESNGNDKVRKVVILFDYQMKDPHHYFMSEPNYKRTNDTFNLGRTKLGTIDVAYRSIKVTKIAQDVLDFGKSKGYTMAQSENRYGTGIQYAKVIGASRQIVILYAEGSEDHEQSFKNSQQVIYLNK